MKTKITTPILLIAFNRPETTTIVFEYIRRAQPTKLYIALDGAREDKLYEDIICHEVKSIVERVDWDCEVHYNINKKNLGAEITIFEAINWVFKTEENAIILEDDIVAPISFFQYAQEMLELYKNEKRIWAISGINFTPLSTADGADYFFAKYGHTWGWATWKRVWNNFDLYAEIKDEHLSNKFLSSVTNTKKENIHYQKKFKRIKDNGIGNRTWDNMASYMHRINNLLYIVPKVNLVSNIGEFGLHARGRTQYHFVEYNENFIIKNHPEDVKCNIDYDKHHFDIYINRKRPLFKRILKKIEKTYDNKYNFYS